MNLELREMNLELREISVQLREHDPSGPSYIIFYIFYSLS